jgi:hypothetical protein
MDCIDEQKNTTTYLRIFDQQGHLRHHDVLHHVFRAPWILNPHNSAQIRDRQTGECYVVDSWYRDNGQPPYIQPVKDWYARKPWPDDENPPIPASGN